MTMKKHVLVVIGSFNIGGTIGSLYSLLSKIDSNRVQVDVFSRLWVGDFMNRLPNCTILPENVWLSHRVMQQGRTRRLVCILLWALRQVFSRIGIDLFKLYGKIGGKQIHSDAYDAVIGFDESLSRIVCYYPAKKRINWIHCDYRRYAHGKGESKYYDKIDTVVCVSDFAKDIFGEVYPKYVNKTVAVHNVINAEDIVAKSQQQIMDERFDCSSFTILSCGRMDPVKQFQLIPSIAEKIKRQTDVIFKWYIIGGGDEILQQRIQNEIDEKRLNEYVILLGQKSNPYPYLAKASVYVCTSSSESFPLVVNEAKALQIPVVCNNFPSAAESIQNGLNGYITTIDEMPKIICNLIKEPFLIKSYESENEHILTQIYNLI